MGLGEIISRWTQVPGGETLRCPKCLGSGKETPPSRRVNHTPLNCTCADCEKQWAAWKRRRRPNNPERSGGVIAQAEEVRDKYLASQGKAARSHPSGNAPHSPSRSSRGWMWLVAIILLAILGIGIITNADRLQGLMTRTSETNLPGIALIPPATATPIPPTAVQHDPSPTPLVQTALAATGDALTATPTSVATVAPIPVPAAKPPPSPISTNIPTSASTKAPTNTRTPEPTETPTPPSTPTSVPPSPTPTPTPVPAPELRHLNEKRYMLELTNAERIKAGLQPVALGDNVAAQLHAESSLDNCVGSHWGIDGLKPYMRYSLAGGYQANGENGHGSDYCIKASDRYRPIVSIEQEVRDAMNGWMNSPGHRRNILGKWHKKVNIGLAWDQYNFKAIQHFEGEYVEYDRLPVIENGVLSLSGTVKNGVAFEDERDLNIRIYYDRPTHPLSLGQLSRTYCYGNGLHIASLREPMTGDLIYFRDEVTKTLEGSSCPDPYDVPADSPAPRSLEEAHEFWQAAYDASQRRAGTESIVVSKVTTSEWTVGDEAFSVTADAGDLLSTHGNGAYTLLMWAPLGGEDVVVSEYSMFLVDPPPPTDSQAQDLLQSPEQRRVEVKQQMLEIINAKRRDAGIDPLTLGDNSAAQLHAEASLEGCFSSRWGLDGLKPYIRYSLAGGFQVNSHYAQGSDYCITASDGYSPKDSIRGWMSSQALDPHYRRVSIGLAWDEFNSHVVLQFEGDYVQYDQLPTIQEGILSLSGTVKNGVSFEEDRDLGVQIYYDPPPRPLTSGQISRVYCSDSGRQIAALRAPLSGNRFYTEDELTETYRPCPDPNEIPPDAPAPRSPDEARQLWREARDASEAGETVSITVPWITALEWITGSEVFAVKTDVRDLLEQYSMGVYSLIVWGDIGSERVVISEYSIFYNVTLP